MNLYKLQVDLNEYLRKYNNERPHSGKFCYGKISMQTFIDSVKIAKEKFITPYSSDANLAA